MADIKDIKDNLESIVLDLVAHDTEEEWFEFKVKRERRQNGFVSRCRQRQFETGSMACQSRLRCSR